MLRFPQLIPLLTTTLLLTACGGDEETPNHQGGSGGGAPAAHAEPPAPGPAKAPDGQGSATFAVRKIYLGDTDRDGTYDTSAWKQYGFDLDGRISTAHSTDVCHPPTNTSTPNVPPDGIDGIDNSFGKTILGILRSLNSNVSEALNLSLANGQFTLLFDIDQLGAAADYNPLVARVYRGADRGEAPTWSGSDLWSPARESVSDPADPRSALAQDPNSYLVGNTWVARPDGDVEIQIPLPLDNRVDLRVHHPIIAMDLAPTRGGATHGTLAGVLDVGELVAETRRIAGALDMSYCDSDTLDKLVRSVEQSADILRDGTQDPSITCTGISIGIGFEAAAVKLGEVGPATPPAAEGCPQ